MAVWRFAGVPVGVCEKHHILCGGDWMGEFLRIFIIPGWLLFEMRWESSVVILCSNLLFI
jgi:hypothetical protein